MQKWEYLTWVVAFANVKDDDRSWKGGVVKRRDGEDIPDWKKGPVLPIALNNAGKEGWELVTVYFSGSGDPVYIFKRPKE